MNVVCWCYFEFQSNQQIFQLSLPHKAMSNERKRELKRAQLVALLKVQKDVKQCNEDNVKYTFTNAKFGAYIGQKVDWVKKCKKIINKAINEHEEKSEEEIYDAEVID